MIKKSKTKTKKFQKKAALNKDKIHKIKLFWNIILFKKKVQRPD